MVKYGSDNILFVKKSSCWFPRSSGLMLPPQTSAKFRRKLLVTFFANRLQIALVEFSFLVHLLIANGTSEMMDTPSLIQRCKNWIKNIIKQSLEGKNKNNHHRQQWLGCKRSTNFRIIDGSVFRNRPVPFFRNGDGRRTASHI